MFLSLLRLWMGPLPKEELFPERKINFPLHWFIHPIKRRVAKYYLWFLKTCFGLKVIAITGSSGKTTTTNFLFPVLTLVGPTIKTADSVTTTYNLPTTILKCTPLTRFLILEMGIEYRGDMDFYTWLAKPDIAILLNVSSVHSSFLGSTTDIFNEKSKLLSALTPSGIALVNSDDTNISWSHNSNTFRFGTRANCVSQVTSSTLTPDLKTKILLKLAGKSHTYTLPLVGRHLASNFAAAAAVFHFLSIPKSTVDSGLEYIIAPPHRLNLITAKSGALIIDDSYNANPLSMSQSLQNLIEISKICKKTPVVVFAQMNELGDYEKPAHQDMGRLIKRLRIKHLFTLGHATTLTVRAAGVGRYFDTFDELSHAVKKFVLPSHCVLIKGSNSWHLERLLSKLD